MFESNLARRVVPGCPKTDAHYQVFIRYKGGHKSWKIRKHLIQQGMSVRLPRGWSTVYIWDSRPKKSTHGYADFAFTTYSKQSVYLFDQNSDGGKISYGNTDF